MVGVSRVPSDRPARAVATPGSRTGLPLVLRPPGAVRFPGRPRAGPPSPAGGRPGGGRPLRAEFDAAAGDSGGPDPRGDQGALRLRLLRPGYTVADPVLPAVQ